nr:uncharacterized protein LOC104094289 [Nicotiana tomentosiformis]
MKEKAEARSEKIKELQSQLSSVVADREIPTKELKTAKSVAEIAKADTDEQHEGEIKSLRAELDAVQKEHADLLEQVQQKVDWVDQLRDEMDEVKALAEEWKGKMDQMAFKKETTREKLASAEALLRSMKEKAEELKEL